MRTRIKQLYRNALSVAAAATLSSLALVNSAGAAVAPGNGTSITPAFSNIAEERFRGEVAMEGLRELGYDVQTPKETAYPAMFLALSYGDADFTVHMWNKLHDSFYQKAGGDKTMIKVGAVMPGVLQGYLIDKKTAEKYNIHSLTDLKDPKIAKLFDANGDGKADLTGCNPGWGCELVVDHHMKAYGLEKTVEVNKGSYFALMADTITRYKEGKPILYFTWVPQWLSNVLVPGKDVEWLSVPYTSLPDGNNDVPTTYKGKNLGFAVDEIMAVMNRDYAKENPAAAMFLSKLQIPAADESAENLKMHNGEKSMDDIKRHAKEWIAAHRDEFDGWLQMARDAAK